MFLSCTVSRRNMSGFDKLGTLLLIATESAYIHMCVLQIQTYVTLRHAYYTEHATRTFLTDIPQIREVADSTNTDKHVFLFKCLRGLFEMKESYLRHASQTETSFSSSSLNLHYMCAQSPSPLLTRTLQRAILAMSRCQHSFPPRCGVHTSS